MQKRIIDLIIKLTACTIVSALLWRFMGAIGLVVSAPLFAIALARPLIDTLWFAYDQTRALAIESAMAGRLEYLGHRIRFVEDDGGLTWLCIDDLRRVVPAFPTERTLVHLYPDACRPAAGAEPAYLSAQATVAVLTRAQDLHTIKFVAWIKREILKVLVHRRPATEKGQQSPSD
jgi:hypothetical protein